MSTLERRSIRSRYRLDIFCERVAQPCQRRRRCLALAGTARSGWLRQDAADAVDALVCGDRAE